MEKEGILANVLADFTEEEVFVVGDQHCWCMIGEYVVLALLVYGCGRRVEKV